ncbi:MAG: hypothetical protein ABSA11_11385 [Candidatus Bathyarchaeia archaeon]
MGVNPLTIVPIHGLGGSKDYWQPIHDCARINVLEVGGDILLIPHSMDPSV